MSYCLFLDESGHGQKNATLKQCVARCAEIVRTGNDLRLRILTAESPEEQIQLRRSWCEQIAQFLDETERMRRLLIDPANDA
jgi:hypothetical protein